MSPRKKNLAALFLGGILPVVAFTVIEEKYGTFWGILAGMAFSLGEMAWEWARHRSVSTVTWATGLLILLLGSISLWASDGIWFKLQPALMEFAFFVLLVGSVLTNKPFLQAAMEKGGQKVPVVLLPFLPGLTLRVGIFFGLHSALAAWAAFFWSTTAWAWLKGVGFTGSFLLYFGIEIFFLRRRLS